jgi:hypothetical protein
MSGLLDPDLLARAVEVSARVAERDRIVAKLAEQMGVSRHEARDALFNFEDVTSSEGQTLH